jgi:hypothetical protein
VEEPPDVSAQFSYQQGLGRYYVESRPLVGYALSRKKLPYEASYPLLAGVREPLGVSGGLGVRLGYQWFEHVSVEGVAEAVFIEGTRAERVRDMAWYVVGAGPKVHWNVWSRWVLYASLHAAYVYVDDQVGKAVGYLGADASVGVQYLMPIRHFSLSLEATALDVGLFERVVVGISPVLRYQF